jgi:hypothetical protein
MPVPLRKIDSKKAAEVKTGEPVPGFPLPFSWHKYYWSELFEQQIDLIRQDIARARAEDRLIIYLSCPISARGGGDQSTNVDIAKSTERRLLDEWGENFWILNPAQYQLESKEGTGLMERHALKCRIDLPKLRAVTPPPAPSGGDYMRMWTKVLVEDQGVKDYHFKDQASMSPTLKNTGQHFDGYYFIGPSDVLDFFRKSGGETLTSSVETHFARKFASDPDFRDRFSIPGIIWRSDWLADRALSQKDKDRQRNLRAEWEELRRKYLRFYALRGSAYYSLGSHDEWEIYRLINVRRRNALRTKVGNLGVAEQIAGFFDGAQIDPGAAEVQLSSGYSA